MFSFKQWKVWCLSIFFVRTVSSSWSFSVSGGCWFKKSYSCPVFQDSFIDFFFLGSKKLLLLNAFFIVSTSQINMMRDERSLDVIW